MNLEDNPFIKPENFFEQYNEQIEELRKNPNYIEMDRLCYEVFGRTEEGKRLLALLQERYVVPGTPSSPSVQNYAMTCVYYEGFRDAYRQLIHATKSYQLRKEAEMNAALKEGD
jgi:hypothetical protein